MWFETVACFVGVVVLLKFYVKMSANGQVIFERMDGKVVIVTGANAGLGYECAKELASRHARVIMACRNASKAAKARDQIVAETGNSDVHVRLIDMLSLQSVRDFAREILSQERRIDVLVNNAGAGGLGTRRTVDGLPPGLQVNHYAPFLLTNLLLGRLKESAPSRVVNVSSSLHKFAWFDVDDINQEKWKCHSEVFTYCNTKLLNVLMTTELARKVQGTGVTTNAAIVGGVRTDFLKNYPVFKFFWLSTIGLFFKSASEGVRTQLFLSVDPSLDDVSGQCYDEYRPTQASRKARDQHLAKKVWELSEAMVCLKDFERHY